MESSRSQSLDVRLHLIVHLPSDRYIIIEMCYGAHPPRAAPLQTVARKERRDTLKNVARARRSEAETHPQQSVVQEREVVDLVVVRSPLEDAVSESHRYVPARLVEE